MVASRAVGGETGEHPVQRYAFQVETTYRAELAGASIAEIPIRFQERVDGVSKMGLPVVLEAVHMVPALRLRRPELGSRPASVVSAGRGT